MEVLVSVSILAGMSLLIYSTMNRSLNSKEIVQQKDELLHSVRLGMGKMAEDLNQAFLAQSSMHGRESHYLSGFKGKADDLTFTTMNHFHYVKDAKDTDQVLVHYFLKKNDAGFFDLMRFENPRLTDKLDIEENGFVLIPNVKSLALSYFDSNEDVWKEDWEADKLSSLGKLPRAVKMELVVVEGNEEEKPREYFFTTMAGVELYQNAINL